MPLVKTSTESRLLENISITDFELSSEEMQEIAALDADIRLFNPKNYDNPRFNRQPYFE